MEPSLFTKIITGDIPCHKIYEDTFTFAFLDIHPVSPGHVLVVPKMQIDHLWDLDDKTYIAVMNTVRKIAQKQMQVLSPARVGIQVVGIDVPHAHVHVIPFNTAEEFRNIPDMNSEVDHGLLADIAQKLQFVA